VLGKNHTPPGRLTVAAICTLDEVDGAPRMFADQVQELDTFASGASFERCQKPHGRP
jgi:hypothetical protein